MKKNKIVALVMVMALAMMTFAGCGNTNNSGSSAKEGNDAKTYKIGICQLLEHPALDKATEGFKDALTDLLGEGNVSFDEQNAQGESANCSTIVSGFVSSNVDLIMANATGALQAAAAATSEIPIVGTSVTDYATALDISDWKGATGVNITGTADLAPLDQQAAMIKELIPDVKQVGLLYCSAEPNSLYQVKMIESHLDKLNVKYKEYAAADTNEIQAVTTNAIGECDALYIPTDNTMANNTELINNIAKPAGIPIIAGEQGICEGCGIATLSIDYYDIGYAAGQMAYDILANGKDPATMDIQTAANVTKLYNKELCEALNITIPEGYAPIEG